MLRESFNNALDNFEFNIIAICVMQNHLHMILKLKNIKEYPKIIYSIKFYFSHRLNKNNKISESKLKKGEKGIWQRRYWEHTISCRLCSTFSLNTTKILRFYSCVDL